MSVRTFPCWEFGVIFLHKCLCSTISRGVLTQQMRGQREYRDWWGRWDLHHWSLHSGHTSPRERLQPSFPPVPLYSFFSLYQRKGRTKLGGLGYLLIPKLIMASSKEPEEIAPLMCFFLRIYRSGKIPHMSCLHVLSTNSNYFIDFLTN